MTATIAASLWSVPSAKCASEARRLHDAGVDRFHWDFADGSMSPAGGFAADTARALTPRGSDSEAHLIMADPRGSIPDWLPFCRAIAVHASQPHWQEATALIEHESGGSVLPVLAVGDATELELADPHWGVLIMAIVPGYAGTEFNEHCVDLVQQAHRNGHPQIGVDGSVTVERAQRLIRAGASLLVSGTSLSSAADPSDWIDAATRGEL